MKLFSLDHPNFEMKSLGSAYDLESKKEKIISSFKKIIIFISPELINRNDLQLVHNKNYIDDLFSKKLKEIIDEVFEFNKYLSYSISDQIAQHIHKRMLQEVSAVFYVARESAINKHDSFYIGGGMHHAESSRGMGFCLYADLAITINKLRLENLIQKVAIIDVDAHFGNGNAEIFSKDQSVETLSIHMKRGWPLDSKNELAKSDIDIEIDQNEEDRYLNKLEVGLNKISKDITIAFIVQGADPYEKDELEGTNLLKLSQKQMLDRDKLVFNFFKKLNVTQVYVMGGGYGQYAHEPYVHFLNFVSIS